jgi:hypothetical protein
LTEGLLQLIQTTTNGENLPVIISPDCSVETAPTVPPIEVIPVHRRANSAYDYFDKEL